MRTVETQVYVAAAQKNLLEDRMKICTELWDIGIKVRRFLYSTPCDVIHFFVYLQTEMSYKANPKLLGQLQTCEEQGIPWAIIIGQSELEKGVVKLRHVVSRHEEEIERTKLADVLKEKLSAPVFWRQFAVQRYCIWIKMFESISSVAWLANPIKKFGIRLWETNIIYCIFGGRSCHFAYRIMCLFCTVQSIIINANETRERHTNLVLWKCDMSDVEGWGRSDRGFLFPDFRETS